MLEKETIRHLDYELLATDIPSEYQKPVRELMASALLNGMRKYDSQTYVTFSRVRPEKFHLFRTFFPRKGVKMVWKWDKEEIVDELEEYVSTSKVTGKTSESIDYMVRNLDISKDFQEKVRALAAISNIAGMRYVLNNTYPSCESGGGVDPIHTAYLVKTHDFDTLNSHLDEFMNKPKS